MASHVTLLITLCPGSVPHLPALWLLPLLDRPGACEDSGIPLSWSRSGQFTHSLTKLRQQVSLIRFVWGVLFHLPFPETDNGRWRVKTSDVKSWGQVGMEKVEGREVGWRYFPSLSAAFALQDSNLTLSADSSCSPAPNTGPLLRTITLNP